VSAPYRRLLWSSDGVEVTVCSEAEESEKVAQGYRLTADPESDADPFDPGYIFDPQESDPPTFGSADDGTGEGPTEGPSDDETHAKKPKRKK